MRRPDYFVTALFLVPALLLSGCSDEGPTGVAPDRPSFSLTAAVCTGTVVLTSQAQVNALACTEVTGDLFIGQNVSGFYTDITDLRPLSTLTSVGGALFIYHNAVLTSLDGLQNLVTVGGSLEMVDNGALSSITGLSSLTSIGNRLYVKDLPALTSLTGLGSFSSVGADVVIESTGLTSLTGLGSLAYSRAFTIQFNHSLASLAGLTSFNNGGLNFTIRDNDALTTLAGLEALTQVSQLYVTENDALTSLEGLQSLYAVNILLIEWNTSLQSLAGLDGVDYIANGIYIVGNSGLTSLEGLSNLTYAGVLRLSSSPVLTSLAGLDNLTGAGNLLLTDLGLTSLAGLETFTSIPDGLSISANPQLTSLAGLNNLTLIGGATSISNNPLLASLDGLEKVSSIGGSLAIAHNPMLTSLAGLTNLTSLGGTLDIENNDALTTLADLNASPGGGLSIRDNDVLTSLAGLESTTSVEFLQIQRNAALTSLAGLENLASVANDVYITDNPMLSTCSCGLTGLISGGAFSGVGGLVTIVNNAPAGTCNSTSAVLASPCAGANRPPVANAGPDQVVECVGPAGASVTLTGTGSTDPDGDVLSFSWSMGGAVIASSAAPTVSFAHGVHTVALTVQDGKGGSHTDDVSITVADTKAPVLMMLGANPLVVNVGSAYVEPGATANDVCEGDLTGAITIDASDVNSSAPGVYDVVYRVTDASGNTAIATRTVQVVAAPSVPVITVRSGPQTVGKVDGKYKNVALGPLKLSVTDASDPALSADQVVITAVWSDEPEMGAGDATRSDIGIAADCRSVKLRAERRDAGNGRVYTLLLEVTNRSGLTGSATYQVFVPVDRSGPAFDDGAAAGHTIAGNCST